MGFEVARCVDELVWVGCWCREVSDVSFRCDVSVGVVRVCDDDRSLLWLLLS